MTDNIDKLAWHLYCRETAGGLDVADFWDDLPERVKKIYRDKALAIPVEITEPAPTQEQYYVLFDPVKQRYYSEDSVGRLFARAAKPFMSLQAAINTRASWWKNTRFSEIRKVTITVETV